MLRLLFIGAGIIYCLLREKQAEREKQAKKETKEGRIASSKMLPNNSADDWGGVTESGRWRQ
jgi:hypothetical protein